MKKLFNIAILLGAVLMLGTAGASDLGSISFEVAMLRELIGLGLVVIGLRGLGGVKRGERE